MRTRLVRLAVIAFLTTLPILAQAQTSPPSRPLVTSAVDDKVRVALAGNTRSETTAATDEGPIAGGQPLGHLFLMLRRPEEREQALERYIDGLTDLASKNYQHWLTAAQVGAAYGPAQSDIDAVTHWLRSQGLAVNTVYSSGMLIDFSGTAAQVSAAFDTPLHNFTINGEHHIANMSDPKIPAALAALVVGPVSLNDFFPASQAHFGPGFTVPSCNFTGDVASTCRLVAPADLATIYDFTPVFSAGNSGQGQTIALIENGDIYSVNDWTGFRTVFHLNAIGHGTMTQKHPGPPSGPNNCSDPGANASAGEATLDIEYASAAAPGADLILASCADGAMSSGLFLAITNLVHTKTPPEIISESYGDCETDLGAAGNAAYFALWQLAAADGISIFVSSDDQGAAACNYRDPFATFGIAANGYATPPYAVAVGGTDFSDVYHGVANQYWKSTNSIVDGSAKSYVPEIPWNNSCASELIAKFVTGSDLTYGASGFCNSTNGKTNFLTTFAGSGAPSTCGLRDNHGNCQGRAKPSWQQSFPGNPSDNVRDIPDVALFSSGIPWGHAYLWCYSDPAQNGFPCSQTSPTKFYYGFGTSFATPIMAGVQALINHHKHGKQGNANPNLYKLAKRQYSGGGSACDSTKGNRVSGKCTFHDITEGDIDVPCKKGSPDCYFTGGTYGVLSTSTTSYKPAYHAHVGWDFATGIGSINVANLVNNWP